MNFRKFFEGISHDYQQDWYHGTDNLPAVEQSGKLITRSEGARRRNAAALGLGIYLTNDPDEAKAFVGSNMHGGVVRVRVIGNPKILRLTNQSQDDVELFDYLRGIGMEDPEKVNGYMYIDGYQGLQWDLMDGSQKLVIYDSRLLSPIQVVWRYTPSSRDLNGTWTQETL